MDQVLIRHRDRILMSEASITDFETVIGLHPSSGGEWQQAWTANADRHCDIADVADAAGFRLTAAEKRAQAAANLHWAQFILYDDPPTKSVLLERQAELFGAAAPNLDPAVERLSFETGLGPGDAYLAFPADIGRNPVVVLVAGLDSTKEELYGWAKPFRDRGWVVALFDAPGLGQLSRVPLTRAAMASTVAALVDALASHPRVDASRIAIGGVSLGGLMATLALGSDARFGAGFVVGAAFDTAPRVGRLNEAGRRGYLHVTQADSVADLEDIVADWSVENLGASVRVPLLVVRSDDDPIIGPEHADRYKAEFSDAQLVVVKHGGQGCYREGAYVLASVADWLNSIEFGRSTIPEKG
jgi:2,6-dihydroxypseudooxynicotine hydrolase